MIRAKNKGSNFERDVLHAFWKKDWACMRAAGSGSTTHPCPDLLAGNGRRRVAIECKATADSRQYFSKKEIVELIAFAHAFGAEPWVAVRFDNIDWFFVAVHDIDETEKGFTLHLDIAQRRGLSLHEFLDG